MRFIVSITSKMIDVNNFAMCVRWRKFLTCSAEPCARRTVRDPAPGPRRARTSAVGGARRAEGSVAQRRGPVSGGRRAPRRKAGQIIGHASKNNPGARPARAARQPPPGRGAGRCARRARVRLAAQASPRFAPRRRSPPRPRQRPTSERKWMATEQESSRLSQAVGIGSTALVAIRAGDDPIDRGNNPGGQVAGRSGVRRFRAAPCARNGCPRPCASEMG